MKLVRKILSLIASYCYEERFEVVFFDPSTSIGMASEMLRLWLHFAGSTNRRIIIVPGYPIFGSRRDRQRVFCKQIYFLNSPFIIRIAACPTFILRLFVTVCYVFTWMLRRVGSRYSTSLHKSIFNSYDVYQPNIFERMDLQLFNAQLTLNVDLNFDQRNRVLCEMERYNFKLPDNYVCIHIRTGAYYAEAVGNIRNANIDNYYRLIINLVERGFYVVRLGDNIELPERFIGLPGFLDYPSSPLKSELCDLWLIKNCAFYIGTPSGILDTAFLFNKDVILTNAIHYESRYSAARYVCLMKTAFLNFHSIMNQQDFYQKLPDLLDHSERFEFSENTESELMRALDAYFSYDTTFDNYFDCHKERLLEVFSPRHEGSVWYVNIEKSKGVLVQSS